MEHTLIASADPECAVRGLRHSGRRTGNYARIQQNMSCPKLKFNEPLRFTREEQPPSETFIDRTGPMPGRATVAQRTHEATGIEPEKTGMIVRRPQLVTRIGDQANYGELRLSTGIATRNGNEGQAVVPHQPFARPDPEISIRGLRDRVDVAARKACRSIPNAVAVTRGDSVLDSAENSADQEQRQDGGDR